MDPVIVPRSRAGISKPMLVALAVALVVGVYLGSALASGLNQSGMGSMVAVLTGVLVAGVLAVMAVIAAILRLSRDESGHRAARSIFLLEVVFAGGIVVGWAVAPLLRPEYRESVVLRAPGTLTVSIEELDEYTSHGSPPTECQSELDAERIASIGGDLVGTTGTAVVGATLMTVAGSPDGRPIVNIWIRPSVEDKGTAPFWGGPADVVEGTEGDRSGRVEFTRITFLEPDKAPPDDYPRELSGTMSWSCGEWLSPDPASTPSTD